MNVARAAGLAYREQGPADGPPVLLVHGYPESSYMWHHALPALGAAGMRAIAPDLAGYGDSEPDPYRPVACRERHDERGKGEGKPGVDCDRDHMDRHERPDEQADKPVAVFDAEPWPASEDLVRRHRQAEDDSGAQKEVRRIR